MGLYDHLQTIYSFIVMSVNSMTSETQNPLPLPLLFPVMTTFGRLISRLVEPGAHG